jgi:hypothetical protein
MLNIEIVIEVETALEIEAKSTQKNQDLKPIARPGARSQSKQETQ